MLSAVRAVSQCNCPRHRLPFIDGRPKAKACGRKADKAEKNTLFVTCVLHLGIPYRESCVLRHVPPPKRSDNMAASEWPLHKSRAHRSTFWFFD
jgi:hypothetical protein